MRETALLAAYASGLSPEGPIPLRIVSAGARTERCTCGGLITVEVQTKDAMIGAILVHQRTVRHRLWWARATAAGWGPGE